MKNQIFLWNDETKKIDSVPVETEGPFLAEAVDVHGKIFHRVSHLPHTYIYPATEEAFLNITFLFWQRNPRSQSANFETRNLDRYNGAFEQRKARMNDVLASSPTLESWLEKEISENCITLKDSKVGYHPNFSPRRAMVARMAENIRKLPSMPRSIVEIGSGFGTFLLSLKQEFPDIHFCGIEPSAAGVAVTRRASEYFGIPVEVIQGKLGEVVGGIPAKKFDLAYTHSLIVQLPGSFLEPIKQMSLITKQRIHLYEHFTEMLRSDRRGYASLYYLNEIAQYETGGFQAIEQGNGSVFHIRGASPVGFAVNALEEAVFVDLEII